jgi:hypothetical protein
MSNIIHDAHVAWWAWRSKHADHSSSRLTVVWPLTVRPLAPNYNGAWIVRIERPNIHILNAYRVELDYMLAHPPTAAK